jgi:hypothetical protein
MKLPLGTSFAFSFLLKSELSAKANCGVSVGKTVQNYLINDVGRNIITNFENDFSHLNDRFWIRITAIALAAIG